MKNNIIILFLISVLFPNLIFGNNTLKEILNKVNEKEKSKEYRFLYVNYKSFSNNELEKEYQDTFLIKQNFKDVLLQTKFKIKSNKVNYNYNNCLLNIYYKKDEIYKRINCTKENLKSTQFPNYFKYLVAKDSVNITEYLLQNIPKLQNIKFNDTICLKINNNVEALQIELDRFFYIYNDEIIKIEEEYFYKAEEIKDKYIYEFKFLEPLNNLNYKLEIDTLQNDLVVADELKNIKLNTTINKEEDKSITLENKFLNQEFIFKDIKNFNGLEAKLEKNDKHKIIFFWGSWCSPCKLAFKPLKEFIEVNSNKYEVIAISVKEKNETDQLKYFKNKDFPFTFHQYGEIVANYYEITSFPTFVILNENLMIKDFEIGYSENFKDYLESLKQEVNQSEP